MAEHHETRDLLGPYVMGSLDPREEREVEEHLQGCVSCREEERNLRVAHEAMSDLAATTGAPPPELKERVVAGMPGGGTNRRVLPAWAAAVAAALLVLAVVGGTFLSGFPGREASASAALQPAEGAPAGAGGEIRVKGVGENAEVHLEAWGLPRCEEEEYYELWFVEGEERVSAGSFTVGDSGEVEVNLNAPGFADSYPQVGVTAERDEDPRPSEEKVLGGELREL